MAIWIDSKECLQYGHDLEKGKEDYLPGSSRRGDGRWKVIRTSDGSIWADNIITSYDEATDETVYMRVCVNCWHINHNKEW